MTRASYKKIIFRTLGVVMLTCMAIAPTQTPHAHAQSMMTWGGEILMTFPCTCNYSLYFVLIGPPKPGYFTYLFGSERYLNYNMPRATWGLGWYSPGDQCPMYIGTGCTTIPTMGRINAISGSSL